jgi:hypothetical protein
VKQFLSGMQRALAICMQEGTYYEQNARGIAAFWGNERLSLPLKEPEVAPALSQIVQVFQDAKLRAMLAAQARGAQHACYEVLVLPPFDRSHSSVQSRRF